MLVKLTDYAVINIQGEEAQKYLQGQLTLDVNQLASGQSSLTAHCDPKGKMVSLFRLVAISSQHFMAIIHRSLLPSALEALKKYAVFSKVQFEQIEAELVGVIEPEQAPPAELGIPLADQRQILLNPQGENLSYADQRFWQAAEIKAGIPYFTAPCQNQFLPQALNLQAIEQAISFQKGCYMGQEMVARAKFRGANKRAMYVFSAQADYCPEVGDALEMQLGENWRETGTIISAVNIDQVLYLQAVLSNQLEPETSFRLAGQLSPLQLLPLPYVL